VARASFELLRSRSVGNEIGTSTADFGPLIHVIRSCLPTIDKRVPHGHRNLRQEPRSRRSGSPSLRLCGIRRRSRQVALIDFPFLKNARRILAAASTSSIPNSTSKYHRTDVGPLFGSPLDADSPKGSSFCVPIHSRGRIATLD
jgi:hypothetical protein